jgi:hypothetical protein
VTGATAVAAATVVAALRAAAAVVAAAATAAAATLVAVLAVVAVLILYNPNALTDVVPPRCIDDILRCRVHATMAYYIM